MPVADPLAEVVPAGINVPVDEPLLVPLDDAVPLELPDELVAPDDDEDADEHAALTEKLCTLAPVMV